MGNHFSFLEKSSSYLMKIPGIGEKNAKRYALWLAEHKEHTKKIIDSLLSLLNNVNICKLCNNLTTDKSNICEICSDPSRNRKTICVVEGLENLFEIESSNVYNGLYFVLGGVISPIYDIDHIIEKMDYLFQRISKEKIEEVILVISSTTEGELTTQYIKEKLKNTKAKITKIASGIPTGTDINYVDRKTLIEAFKARVSA